MFEAVGNSLANSVWEARLSTTPSGRTSSGALPPSRLSSSVGPPSSSAAVVSSVGPSSSSSFSRVSSTQTGTSVASGGGSGAVFFGMGRKSVGSPGGAAAAGRASVARTRPLGGMNDAWVWNDDDDESSDYGGLGPRGGGLGGAAGAAGAVTGGAQGGWGGPTGGLKPTTASPLADKMRYITDKYVNRRYAEPMSSSQAQSVLWDGVEAGDLR